jgi:putative transposase
MGHTYATNVGHCVFSTKERAPLIPAHRLERLWAYLLGIAGNMNVPILAMGGSTNHVHILLALPPARNLAKVVCDLQLLVEPPRS